MSGQPGHNLGHAAGQIARRQGRAVDHYHPNPQDSCRIKLGPRPAATRILGNDQADPAALQQRQIISRGEGSARDHRFGIRQGQCRRRRIDKAQQVVVLRHPGKGPQILLADRQKNPGPRLGQGRDCCADIFHMVPVIAWFRSPGRALKGQKRGLADGAGFNGIPAHLRREWVGCIDDMSNLFGPEPVRQPRRPAKAADTHRQGLRGRAFRATGIGKHGIQPRGRDGMGKLGSFGCAAQNEEACHG